MRDMSRGVPGRPGAPRDKCPGDVEQGKDHRKGPSRDLSRQLSSGAPQLCEATVPIAQADSLGVPLEALKPFETLVDSWLRYQKEKV